MTKIDYLISKKLEEEQLDEDTEFEKPRPPHAPRKIINNEHLNMRPYWTWDSDE